MTKCSPSFWSLRCRHGFWVHVYLIFTLHSSVFLQTIVNVWGCALPPFSRWHESENGLCYFTGQYIVGARLPPLESPSPENMVIGTLAPGWAVITVGSPRERGGDTPACTSCLWWAAMHKWLFSPPASSLMLGVAVDACPRARQSSLGLP